MQGVSNTITVVDGIDLKIHVDPSCGLAGRTLLRRVPGIDVETASDRLHRSLVSQQSSAGWMSWRPGHLLRPPRYVIQAAESMCVLCLPRLQAFSPTRNDDLPSERFLDSVETAAGKTLKSLREKRGQLPVFLISLSGVIRCNIAQLEPAGRPQKKNDKQANTGLCLTGC